MNKQISTALTQGDNTPVALIGTQKFMGKKIPVITGGFGKDNRVMTDKTIAEIHGMEIKNVRARITDNIKRFKESVDIIDILNCSLPDKQQILEQLGYSKMQISKAEHIYMLSERGYSKLIKIMDTDLAWDIHDKVIDDYFTLRERSAQSLDISRYSPEMQAILMHDEKLNKVEDRVNKLENNMTLDYGQQQIIQALVNKRATEVLGGKTSMAYKLLSKKTFPEVYRSLKNSFHVPSYKDIPVIHFERAKEMVLRWVPSQELNLMIIGANTQAIKEV